MVIPALRPGVMFNILGETHKNCGEIARDVLCFRYEIQTIRFYVAFFQAFRTAGSIDVSRALEIFILKNEFSRCFYEFRM